MILQINKELDGTKRTDLLDGVKRTNCLGNDYVMVQFLNGDVHSYSKDGLDSWFDVDCAPEMHDYTIKAIWLLNDEGKTLKRLI